MKIFIGGSDNRKDLLDEVCAIVEEAQATPIPWNKPGLFPPGSHPHIRLPEIAKGVVDAAILIYSGDNTVWNAGEKNKQPRENVIFEHGLFCGIYGSDKAIIILDGKQNIPGNFKGATYIDFSKNKRAQGKQLLKNWIAVLKKQWDANKTTRRQVFQRKNLIDQQLVFDSGLKSFFPDRTFYPRYRDKIGSIDSYINTAKNSLFMISINLATGLPIDGICNVLGKKLQDKKNNFISVVSLLNPDDSHLMESVAPVLGFTRDKLAISINDSLDTLKDFRNSLPKDKRKYFDIRVHKSIPFGSAIIMDHKVAYGKIQIETKPYKAPRQKSFAFEIVPISKNCLFHTLVNGYIQLMQDGNSIVKNNTIIK